MWNSSSVESASYDEASSTWSVEVTRSDGSAVTLQPTQLVLATGMSGFPNMPTWPGMEEYAGEVVHSSATLDEPTWKGKRVVVVGSNVGRRSPSILLFCCTHVPIVEDS